jgi:hypothetical protein
MNEPNERVSIIGTTLHSDERLGGELLPST